MSAKPKSVKAVRAQAKSSKAKPTKAESVKSKPIKAAVVKTKFAKTTRVITKPVTTNPSKIKAAKAKSTKATTVKTKPSKVKAAKAVPIIPNPPETTPVNPRIMLDLETFGITPGAVIVTIGAVKFDETRITEKFDCKIDPKSCLEYGLHEEKSAKDWWSKQNQKARAEVTKKGGLKLPEALEKFAAWIGDSKPEIWGHGSDFDNVLLAAAYRACNMPVPWHYSRNRCYRTVSRMNREAVPFQGNANAHKALEDAKVQAVHLIKILNYLNTTNQK